MLVCSGDTDSVIRVVEKTGIQGPHPTIYDRKSIGYCEKDTEGVVHRHGLSTSRFQKECFPLYG